MANETRIELTIDANGKPAVRVLDDVGDKVAQTNKQATESSAKSAVSFSASWAGAATKIAGAYYAMSTAIKFASAQLESMTSFETSMANVHTLVDRNTGTMAAWRKEIRDMAPDVKRLTTDLSGGLYQVVSAIGDVDEKFDVLRVSAKAATAGLSTTFTAVDVGTTVLNAYGLAASETTGVMDTMFTTVKYGKTTFDELAGSVGDALPIAAQLGIEFDEVGAAIAALTAGGLNTSKAVTGLRSMFTSLINQADEFRDRGVDIIDVAGERGLTGVFQELARLTGGNSEAMRALIPDTEGFTAALSLAGAGGKKFAEVLDELEDKAGTLDEAFKKVTKTTQGAKDEFFSELDVLTQETGEIVLPLFTWIVQTGTTGVRLLEATFQSLSAILLDSAKNTFHVASAFGYLLDMVGLTEDAYESMQIQARGAELAADEFDRKSLRNENLVRGILETAAAIKDTKKELQDLQDGLAAFYGYSDRVTPPPPPVDPEKLKAAADAMAELTRREALIGKESMETARIQLQQKHAAEIALLKKNRATKEQLYRAAAIQEAEYNQLLIEQGRRFVEERDRDAEAQRTKAQREQAEAERTYEGILRADEEFYTRRQDLMKRDAEARTSMAMSATSAMMRTPGLEGDLGAGFNTIGQGMQSMMEIETGTDQYTREMERAQEHYAQMEELYKEHEDRKALMSIEAARLQEAQEGAIHSQRIGMYAATASMIMGSIQALSAFTGKNNQVLFYAQKAYSMSMAFMAASEAAAKWAAVPPMAIAVKAFGMAQVAAIAATTLQGPGGSGGGAFTMGGGYGATASGPSPESLQAKEPEKESRQPIVNIHIQGAMYGDVNQAARALAQPIALAFRDGVAEANA